MIVLDTTVLTYAAGVDHPLREPCRRLFDATADGRLVATTTAGVIQEFAHVYARRRSRSQAAARAAEYSDLLAPLLEPAAGHVGVALELFETHRPLDAFDAFLAAAALEAEASALVSADRAFAGIPGLRHVDPASPELDELLRP